MAGAKDTRCCGDCGAAIDEHEGRGRPRKFCATCRPTQAGKKRTEAGGTITCKWCGSAATVHYKSVRYCSDECKKASTRKLFRAAAKRRAAAKNPNRKPAVKRKLHCEQCGCEFKKTGKGQRFCSKKCYGACLSQMAGTEDCRKEFVWQPSEKVCQFCNQEFTQTRPSQRNHDICSSVAEKAGQRRHRFRRRALERAAKVELVDPYDVLIRDGWTCQLCGIATPAELRGTYEDNAPEVDHIVPLAAGGEHSMVNMQCACRRCNLAKGANAEYENRIAA